MTDEKTKGSTVGIAWYRADQYELLRDRATDPEILVDKYEDWVEHASKMFSMLATQGMDVEKVEVDVEEMLAWCEAEGRPFDGNARALFVNEALKRRQGPEDTTGE